MGWRRDSDGSDNICTFQLREPKARVDRGGEIKSNLPRANYERRARQCV